MNVPCPSTATASSVSIGATASLTNVFPLTHASQATALDAHLLLDSDQRSNSQSSCDKVSLSSPVQSPQLHNRGRTQSAGSSSQRYTRESAISVTRRSTRSLDDQGQSSTDHHQRTRESLEEEEQALINEIELRLKAIEDAVSHARGVEKMFPSQAQQQLNQVTHQSTECRQKLATLQQEYLK